MGTYKQSRRNRLSIIVHPPNPHIFITLSLFSLLIALALHICSLSVVPLHHLFYEQHIVHSPVLPLVSDSNFMFPTLNHTLKYSPYDCRFCHRIQ